MFREHAEMPAMTDTNDRRLARRAMRDFTGFLAIAWAAAEIALWVGGV